MMNYVLLLAILALAPVAASAVLCLSFAWTAKLCNRIRPVSESIAQTSQDIPSLDHVLNVAMSRLAVSIASYEKLDELSELVQEAKQSSPSEVGHSYKNAYRINDAREA